MILDLELAVERAAATEALSMADSLHERGIPTLTRVTAAAMLVAITLERISRNEADLRVLLDRLDEVTRLFAAELLKQRQRTAMQ